MLKWTIGLLVGFVVALVLIVVWLAIAMVGTAALGYDYGTFCTAGAIGIVVIITATGQISWSKLLFGSTKDE